MFKILPAFEKEFSMEEVDKATPDWLKFVLLGFVILVLIGSIFI